MGYLALKKTSVGGPLCLYGMGYQRAKRFMVPLVLSYLPAVLTSTKLATCPTETAMPTCSIRTGQSALRYQEHPRQFVFWLSAFVDSEGMELAGSADWSSKLSARFALLRGHSLGKVDCSQRVEVCHSQSIVPSVCFMTVSSRSCFLMSQIPTKKMSC